MSDRYTTLFRLPSKLYLAGSPVLISAGAIQKDNENYNLLAQIKIQNISVKPIIACKIRLEAYSVSGESLDGVESFSYLDLFARPGEFFGTKTPVYLPNYESRRIKPCIIQVVFNDNSVWESDSSDWIEVDEPSKIEDKIHDADLVKQYKLELGNNSDYYPKIIEGLFYCTCGSINMESVEQCYSCGRNYTDLAEILEDGYLISRKEARLTREAEERRTKMQREAEERAAKLQKRQKRKERIAKILKIAIPIVVALVIVSVIAYIFVPKFYSYFWGRSQYDNGNYQKAADEFESLNGFLDSEEQLLQCRYMMAKSAYDKGLYAQALEVFEELGDYSDSANNALQCRYVLASEAYDNGDYATALSIYQLLGDYGDSANSVLQCQYMQASDAYDEGDFITAREIFLSIEDYSDVSQRLEDIDSLESIQSLMRLSISDAYAALHEMNPLDPNVVRLLETCNDYIQYCGDRSWEIDGVNIEFNSDFSIDSDGTVYWHYSSDYDGPYFNGERCFLELEPVYNNRVSHSFGDFETYHDFNTTVYFNTNRVYLEITYYVDAGDNLLSLTQTQQRETIYSYRCNH